MIGKVTVLLSLGGDHVEAIKSANEPSQPPNTKDLPISSVISLSIAKNIGGVSLSLRIWQAGFPPRPRGHFSSRLITRNLFHLPTRGSARPADHQCDGSLAFSIPLTFDLVPGVAASEMYLPETCRTFRETGNRRSLPKFI